MECSSLNVGLGGISIRSLARLFVAVFVFPSCVCKSVGLFFVCGLPRIVSVFYTGESEFRVNVVRLASEGIEVRNTLLPIYFPGYPVS